jgi:thiol-disulfide isomerase/thioredoxin
LIDRKALTMRVLFLTSTLMALLAFVQLLAAAATPSPPASTSTGQRDLQTYPVRGTAPELLNPVWLNTDAPLRLSALRGQVILLEFWTFDCINCIRTIPYIEQWHQTYQEQGLVVIGNHFPEYSYERDVHNVRDALTRLNITYPVALDNTGATWDAYNQRYWPTIYLIDKWGDLRYIHIGEGRYDETEKAIKALLSETYELSTVITTPEPYTYLTASTDLNVRAGAGTEYEIIGSIHPGMAFVILSETADWYEISYNDGTGYVAAAYVARKSM